MQFCVLANANWSDFAYGTSKFIIKEQACRHLILPNTAKHCYKRSNAVCPHLNHLERRLEWCREHYLQADAVHDKPFRLSFLQKEFDRQASFTYVRSQC